MNVKRDGINFMKISFAGGRTFLHLLPQISLVDG